MIEHPAPVQPTMAQPNIGLPAWVHDLRYAALTTFRTDGSGVASPIWFAAHGATLLVRTPTATAKVRRLTAEPRVELEPCDWKGRPVPGALLEATAEVLPRLEAVGLEPVLRARYGWQWNIVPMIPLPGDRSAHRGLPLRDRIAMARAQELWTESSILRITPTPASG